MRASSPGQDLSRGARDAGFSLLEILVATALSTLLMILAYALFTSTRRSATETTELIAITDAGNAIFDILASEIRGAGYSPLGARFTAIPSGTATRIRLLSDRDGNGTPGAPGLDEDLSYVFLDPDGDQLFDLVRGVDLNGDGAFLGPGESSEVLSRRIVAVDADGDGVLDPFFAYDAPPPATRSVRVAFGIRTARPEPRSQRLKVVTYATSLLLRNRGTS